MGTTEIPTIETARLRLRPFEDADVSEWTRLIYADADVTRYLPGTNATPYERTQRMYHHFTEHWPRHGFGEWAVTDRESGAFLGQCGLNHIDDIDETEVDYALAKHAWGRGLATEAAERLVRIAFDERGFDRLFALVFPENAASARVLQKLGFVPHDRVARFGGELDRHVLRRPT